MSNPIAENAHYFARRKRLTEDYGNAEPQAPAIFDPRASWRRVVNRVSLATDDQDNEQSSFSDEERFRDTFQLLRGYRPERLEEATQKDDDDDALPSAQDLQHDQDDSGDGDNFFAHPFPQEEQRQYHGPKRTMRISVPQDSSPPLAAAPAPQPPPGEGGETTDATKSRWSKTIDRIKLVANLQTFHERTGGLLPSMDTSLAPYFPPLFEPSFISLSVDEYGRKLPPILLPMLNVAVTDSEYIARGVNQWMFRVELSYGDIKWVIRRSIADFVGLHYTLKFKSSLSDNVPAPPPFPDQVGSLLDSARTTIGLDRSADDVESYNGTAARASSNEDIQEESLKRETALNRRIALTDYLRALLSKSHLTVSYDICEFLEVSAVSIVPDMGWKGKEGFMENRVRNLNPNACQLWRSHTWTKQWVLLRDSYIAFCEDIASSSPSEVLLFDRTFKVTVSEPTLLGSYHMTLATQFRHIEIKGSLRQVDEWRESIAKVQSDSPWVKPHRFDSFAPIRYNAKVKWFVDGENHFNAVAEGILSARSEIYIADWWLSPELYLRRPPEKNQEFRIDRLLQRKAREGVMIYIIVYKEMSLALTIDSAHTKQWLQSLHPNIIVQRHPDRRPFENSVLFWSHHEKIVVVDNRVALVGGLDLCFGRFDTHSHRHADYPAKGHQYQMFPGQDYSSPRVKDFANVSQHDMTLVDRELTPRMPWHDMSVAVVGPIARDVARLFIQRWNFLKASKSMHRPSVPYLTPKGEYVAQRDESKFEGTCRVQLLRSAATWSSAIAREHSIYNAYVECISRAKHFIYIENQFFITATGEDKIVRNKIGQAIVERIKRAYYVGEKFKVFILIPLIPAFEGDLTSGDSAAARGVMHFQYTSISRGGNSIMEKLREEGIDPHEYIGWYSLRNWDKIEPRLPRKKKSRESGVAGSPPSSSLHQHKHQQVESLSIQDSADHEESEVDDRDHYVSELVYIHDKLLIVDDRLVIIGSANINDRSMLGNRDSEVAMLIEDRELVPSYMNGEEYRASKFALSLRIQLWKEHLGLLDFENWESLLDPDDENLVRNCCAPTDLPVHEEHSSSTAPSGPTVNHSDSGNDEEIRGYEADEAVRLLDRVSRTRSVYDSLKHHHYQPALKREAAALDPLTDRCYYNIWRKTAETNTLAYRDLFRTVPDDTVHTFEEHRRFVASDVPYGHVADPNKSSHEIQEKLSTIRGHLVQFPVEYLKDENLLNVIESMAPMVIFT